MAPDIGISWSQRKNGWRFLREGFTNLRVHRTGEQIQKPSEARALLHVYDIIPMLSFMRFPFYHLGIEVYGEEYFYGDRGIEHCQPGRFSRNHHQAECIGCTELDVFQVYLLLDQLSKEFTAAAYSIVGTNCQTFAIAFSRGLGIALPTKYCSFISASPRLGPVAESCTAPFENSCHPSCSSQRENTEAGDDEPIRLMSRKQGGEVQLPSRKSKHSMVTLLMSTPSFEGPGASAQTFSDPTRCICTLSYAGLSCHPWRESNDVEPRANHDAHMLPIDGAEAQKRKYLYQLQGGGAEADKLRLGECEFRRSRYLHQVPGENVEDHMLRYV